MSERCRADKYSPSSNQKKVRFTITQHKYIRIIHIIETVLLYALILDGPETLIANYKLHFRYSYYSNDYSPICNAKSTTLLYLCDNSLPNITPTASESTRTCSADNEKSDSDASDRHISESGADLIMHSYPQINSDFSFLKSAFINSLYLQIKTLKTINEKLLLRNHSIISELDEVEKLISFQIVLSLYALDRIVLVDSTTPIVPIYDVLRLDEAGKSITDNELQFESSGFSIVYYWFFGIVILFYSEKNLDWIASFIKLTIRLKTNLAFDNCQRDLSLNVISCVSSAVYTVSFLMTYTMEIIYYFLIIWCLFICCFMFNFAGYPQLFKDTNHKNNKNKSLIEKYLQRQAENNDSFNRHRLRPTKAWIINHRNITVDIETNITSNNENCTYSLKDKNGVRSQIGYNTLISPQIINREIDNGLYDTETQNKKSYSTGNLMAKCMSSFKIGWFNKYEQTLIYNVNAKASEISGQGDVVGSLQVLVIYVKCHFRNKGHNTSCNTSINTRTNNHPMIPHSPTYTPPHEINIGGSSILQHYGLVLQVLSLVLLLVLLQ